jgi:DNA-binding NtrC family response regulator
MNGYLKLNLPKFRLFKEGVITAKLSVSDFISTNNSKKLVYLKYSSPESVVARTILIVDNEPNILRLLYSVLSPSYKLVLKKHAVEAIGWLEEGNKPALVITEFNHQHFSAPQFVGYFKSSGIFRDVPILILTEDNNINQEGQPFSQEVASVIHKPFNPIYLKNIIKSILNG